MPQRVRRMYPGSNPTPQAMKPSLSIVTARGPAQPKEMQAWLIQDWWGEDILHIVIGTEQDARDWVATNREDVGRPEQVNGPYPFTIAIKP